jgi:hypothetical protein
VFGRKPQLLRAWGNSWGAFDVHDILPAGLQSGDRLGFPTGLGLLTSTISCFVGRDYWNSAASVAAAPSKLRRKVVHYGAVSPPG